MDLLFQRGEILPQKSRSWHVYKLFLFFSIGYLTIANEMI
jgi:hypothetical protein